MIVQCFCGNAYIAEGSNSYHSKCPVCDSAASNIPKLSENDEQALASSLDKFSRKTLHRK